MKRVILTICVTFLMLFAFMTVAQADDTGITVYVNETELSCDIPPYIENERTMVPMRKIFEALEATVEWEDATQTITATKGNTKIVLQIASPVMYVNDKPQPLDVAPVIVESSTFVPLRAVSQSLNASVEWFNFARRAYINSSNTYEMDVFAIGTIYAGYVYTKDFSSTIEPGTDICTHGTVTGVLSKDGHIYLIANNLYAPSKEMAIYVCADDMTDFNLISKLFAGKTIAIAGTYQGCDDTGINAMTLEHTSILEPDDIIFLEYEEMIYPSVSQLEANLKAEAKVTIFSPYSGASVVFGHEIDYYLSQGWYLEPVCIIYNIDGHSSVIYEYELDYYLSQGWYEAPPEN